MAYFTESEYGKYIQLQNVSGSGDPASAPKGGVYLFASGTMSNAKLYMQLEDGNPIDLEKSVDIDTFTELDEAPHATQDEFLVSDNGTEKRVSMTNLAKGVFALVTGGDATINSDGELTIAAQAVENSMLADDAVNSDEIADGAIDTVHIANDQVTNDKLANIARGSVKVGGASNAPTDLDAKTSGQILVGDGTDVVSVAVGGDATLAANGTLTLAGAQTNITSLLATDIKIGEDDQTKIDFETADEIHFYAANAEQVYVADGVFGPQTDSDVTLGADSVAWSKLFVDDIDLNGQGRIDLDADADTSIRSAADDQIQFEIGGSDKVTMTASGIAVTGVMSGSSKVQAHGATFTSNLAVSGSSELVGAVSTSGKMSGSSEVLFQGNAFLGGTLNVTGAVNLASNLLPVTAGGTNLGSATLELGDVYLADDKKIYFGSDQDASIEYDEDGTDELRFAGAAVTFEEAVTFDGAVTLGDATGDDVVITGRIAADIDPKTDNTYDLGAASLQWKDLYVNGIGYIDQLGTDADPVAAYISSGEIDGVVIGGESAAAATFTTVTVNTSLLPDAAGGADIGSTGAEFGDVYIADDKKIYFGNDQDASIEYDEDGSDQLRIAAPAAGVVIAGTTPTLVIGDADAEDSKLVFDGNAQDFYMGLDDSADKLLIGLGSTVGTTPNMTLESASRNVGFHGNIQVIGENIANSQGVAAISLDSDASQAGFSTLGGFGGGGGVTFAKAASGGTQFATAVTINKSDGSMSNDFKVFGDTAGAYFLYDASADKVIMHNGSAQVLELGTTTSGYAIEVANLAGDAGKIQATAFVTYSDESLKEEVTAMDNALDAVMSLNGVEFTWKGSGERDFGFLAQDVKSVLPQAVSVGNDGIHGVDYSRLTSVLVEAVKAQQVQIDDLKKVITNLKK